MTIENSELAKSQSLKLINTLLKTQTMPCINIGINSNYTLF